MVIPFSIEVVNKELLEAVKNAKLSGDEAESLNFRMLARRKRKITTVIVAAVIFLLSVAAFFAVVHFNDDPPAALMIGLLACWFIGLFMAIFALNSLLVAIQYISALKKSYPNVRGGDV